MRNTGILLIFVGIFLFINAVNIREVLLGRATISFLNPKEATTPTPGNKSGTGGT